MKYYDSAPSAVEELYWEVTIVHCVQGKLN